MNLYELKRINIMEEINEYEIDGLIQTMKETGIKGLMKYTDVLVLNHMMERGWIPPIEKRDEQAVISILIETVSGYQPQNEPSRSAQSVKN